ncbi:hypothetical protein [Thalassolituus oleivorans]|uniref:hypothetical protein n=1 Tax=Thalassolituus oleivorans TaxID=187493 RepID=UPI0023F50BE6|nr:hypothetical protein [Thalassolituus oleivorans]
MNDIEGSRPPENNPLKKSIIIWGCVSTALALIMVTSNNSAMVLGASFGAKLLAFILGASLGVVGAILGDAIRRFAAPDIMLTSGMGSLIWQKIFWRIGPQSIGCFIGISLGASLVLG